MTRMDAIKIPNALQVMVDQLFMINSLIKMKPVTACAFCRVNDKQLNPSIAMSNETPPQIYNY